MVPVSLFRSFCAYNLCASGGVNVCFFLFVVGVLWFESYMVVVSLKLGIMGDFWD